MKKFQILILAAGRGKRMGGGEMPKVLQPILGKPILGWLLESVRQSGLDERPAIVVGHGAEFIKKEFGDGCFYIEQKELLGTGDAVRQSRPFFEDKIENLIVLYGDHPFIPAEVLENLAKTHVSGARVLTMITTTVPNFSDWRATFRDYGRIIRDQSGRIQKIIEAKDATDAEREIKEVNPGIYCFRASWLWPHLDKLTNNNAQGEYLLTDLLGLAIAEGEEVATVPLDAKNCLGVNSPEQLALVEKLFS